MPSEPIKVNLSSVRGKLQIQILNGVRGSSQYKDIKIGCSEVLWNGWQNLIPISTQVNGTNLHLWLEMATERAEIAELLKSVSIQKLYEDCIRGSDQSYYTTLTGSSEPIIRKKKDKAKYDVEKTIRGYVTAVPGVLKHCDINHEGMDTIDILEFIMAFKPPSAGQLGYTNLVYTSDDVTVHNQLIHLYDLMKTAYKAVSHAEGQPKPIPQAKLKIAVKPTPIKITATQLNTHETLPPTIKKTSDEQTIATTKSETRGELNKQEQIIFKYILFESNATVEEKKMIVNLMFAKEWSKLEKLLNDLTN